jgi:Phospholipase_D-nuclease N-terminal
MTGLPRAPRTQHAAEHLIRRACRRLPGEASDERYREWAAELPAILSDPDVGSGIGARVRRSARALGYAAGVSRCARRLGRAWGQPRPGASLPAQPGFPVRRVVVGVLIYVAVVALFIALGTAFQPPGRWLLVPALPAAAGFAAFCLADLGRARQVRYLPKWAWAIACLVQIPLGGIMYLAAGKAPAARPAPPAQP